ncbi:Tyrosine aminotransferase [Galdieria sulphuraria]|nr:Tyrosine aminotransferase [Galdieria sulphuraria]
MLFFIGGADISSHLGSFWSEKAKIKYHGRIKRKRYWRTFTKGTCWASMEQGPDNETAWKQGRESWKIPKEEDDKKDGEEAEDMNRVLKELSQRFDWPKEQRPSSKRQVSVDPILFNEPSFLRSHAYEDFIKESEQARKRNHVNSMDTESFMRLFENARKGWLSCPQCKGLAPPEEIEKWGWCSYCHAEIDLKRSPAEILYPQDDEKKTDKQKKNETIQYVSKRVVQREWKISCSKRAMETVNPIRQLVQGMAVKPNPDKKLIALSIGDPTAFGNLKVPREAMKALSKVLAENSAHGYANSLGNEHARSAIASKYSYKYHSITKDEVILTCGTSGALEMVFNALCNPGDNVLIPRPGFPLFKTLLDNLGVEVRYYDLDPHQRWQIRLEKLPQLVDNRTAALVVNNPSNPCGSVFSYSHMMAIVEMAQRLCIPIVADEVYSDMTFSV